MRLSAKSEYGLLALIDLAAAVDRAPMSTRDIATRRDIPLAFLEQLLATLRREGLVTAVRGAHGGFVLARDAHDISALDVVEALEGPLSPTVCDGQEPCGRGGACAAEPVWMQVSTTLREVLGRFDLASLAQRQLLFDATTGVTTPEE
ncbi:MAG: Rrf2 family transcriptional regulator [Coriobacteriia bacterium]|nr:Rrf2 family transcriptional regulator [Coriobacteriia bacterium]MBN2823579.1 Rrf2 family transcriptional regulator [Coriobacteriia bacterium]